MDSKNGSYNSEKFHHSIAVPRIYKDTSKLLEKYWNKEGRLNNLVYETKFQSHLKRLYGTACAVLNQYPILEEALKAVPLFEEQPQFKRSLAYVLSSEILKKNGPLLGNSKPIQVINSYHKAILEAAKNAQSQTPEQNILPGKCCPKYGRVNTLIQSTDAAFYSLKNIGWKFIDYDVSNIKYDEYLDIVENLEKCSYTKDYHVPKLLVFPPCVEFWKMNIFKKGGIIAQNKASCLPAFVSNVKPGDTVIDACAAPGNKTCHLASLMSNEGRLIAIDKDFKRFQTLQSYLQKGRVQCAETLNVDFTALNPSDYEDVKVIVVDPSCSSSGTVAHRDEISRERITKLSNFQSQILRHALSFPKVETVVYSTCSVNEEENEVVVEDVLQCCNEFVLEDLSKRIPDHSGLEKFEIGKHCLRMNSSKDKCEGFFVAKFIRKENSSKTEIGIKKRKLKCDGNVNKFKNKRTKTFGCLFFLAINL